MWSTVAADLVENVITGSSGTLSAHGRSAIRLVFHDCFPQACDGSIILAGECDGRAENLQLTGICRKLGDKASEYGVGTADLIQLAGGEDTSACPFIFIFLFLCLLLLFSSQTTTIRGIRAWFPATS